MIFFLLIYIYIEKILVEKIFDLKGEKNKVLVEIVYNEVVC